jgi:hypothetical protein
MSCARALLVCTFLLAACGSKQTQPPPMPDAASFEATAYPVLLRDCAFPACHASNDRFFQVYGPGRVRLNPDPMLDVYQPATQAELQLSYERARSMLSSPKVEDSLLLRKPLEASAGGAAHKGDDELGRNVYRTKQDAGYQALLLWATNMAPQTAAAMPAAMPGAQP